MSINAMLSIGKDSLIMNQYALTIVSDNIANMNVEGYARQRIEQETVSCDLPIKNSNGLRLTSMGARIADIKRYTNNYIDGQLRDANCDSCYYTELQDAANVLESLLNELNGNQGLNAAFTEFYSALNDMASNPTDLATRAVVAQKAENITSKFNQFASVINEERINQVGSGTNPESVYTSVAASKVSAVNTLLDSIADVNINIAQLATSTSAPSSLIEKRNSLLQELSSYIPVDITENSVNGTCNVSFKGINLISGGMSKGSFEIQATGDVNDPAKVVIIDNDGNQTDVTSQITSGSLGASLQLGSSSSSILSYTAVLNKLDILAAEFAQAFNEVQTYVNAADGKASLSMTLDANGNKILKDAQIDGSGNLVTSNDPLFEAADGSATINAANITVNANILSNPYGIAAALGDVDASTGAAENNLAVGDTQSLLDMLALRSKGYLNLDGNTFDGFVTSLATDLGVKVASVNSYADTADSSLTQLLETKTSLGGVNLDEELVDLIKYQRAYEASARVFNVATEVMKTLVTLGQ